VVVCLKKALKIASNAQQAAAAAGSGAGDALSLFITVLNKYLYFFDQGCPTVTLTVLQASSDNYRSPRHPKFIKPSLNPR
jgi:vacuolar protein sorting-associated protein 35